MKALRLRLALLAAALSAALLACALPAGAATPAPKKAPRPITTGIVDIYTTLGYQSGEAAGTGMIVGPDGEVLTNNHVIRGATVFKVVDVTTKKTYTATVVGYSVSQDVGVLRLERATKLATIARGNSATLRVGQKVAALGNALGRGTRSPATGTITGLGRPLTAYDTSTGLSENLTGMIETSAPVQPGDSGGPLFNASWRAVGMVTAGSSTLRFQSQGDGYAIPINRALALAKQIWTGQPSSQVHIGPTAFLGVRVQDAPAGGALLSQVISGTAAEAAGLVAGDTITSLNGVTIGASSDLTGVVLALKPGTSYPIEWVGSDGTQQTGTITPQAGPPQ